MVTFEQKTLNGSCDVMVNDKLFGRISRFHGFFIDERVVRSFMEVSADDLRAIALKSEEVRKQTQYSFPTD